ncbi:unnamed protein product (macronuclear) [Paramecium tetraurelia]|uniref:Alpha-type protein kinase domain-containing protein n=1 Tax=Paramecium tetraurelia TaxID=5888 RepID=A0E3N6_PARTE|nr:uncharacterized protein GSPATT00023076001 [Paramecium tetraurelia]CAK89903.1 unnamed protein product [Paramecium tetraurelia]|eukprot:XP_001457300.1 hypothetical protein (macronuclear) [Paramecium tetraurelia strain d4-2]
MDNFQVQDLCYDNIKCHDWQCQKKHPRCFAGICIQGLNDDEECNIQNCQLFHVSSDTLSNEIMINGFYRYNICKKKNCEVNTCRYLHPTWIKDYCVDFFQNKCKQNCNNHLKWAQMKNQIYEKYEIQNLNPDVLCKKDKCKCQKHLANIDDFCIDYFQGICPLIECSKKHVFWEELKSNRKLQFEEPKLKPCNKKNVILNQEGIENNSQIKVMIDEQELKRMHKALQQQNIIDIIFIMDCTKTMDHWIQQCHSQMASIIEKFQNQNNKYITRVGFVGYRDIIIKKQKSIIQLDRKSMISSEVNDQFNQNDFEIVDKNHVVFHDLTDKIDSIKEFIKQQKAYGGGDEAEDVVAGIEKASQLNISKHQDTVLITFLFADSPCHGKQYHDIDDDDFMDKIPLDTLEDVMRRYRKIKTNNFFFCSRISQKTDKMFTIMKSVFPEVSITDHITPEDFPNLISFSLQDSFSKISKSQLFKPIEIKAQSIKSKYIEYDCKTIEDRIKFWGNFVQVCQSQERVNHTIIKINQNQEQILENEDGVNSYIFKVFDVINNQNLVAKIPKKIIQEYQQKEQILKQSNSNEKVKLSEESIQEAKKFAQSRFISQTIAKQLAKIYREKVQNLAGSPPIFYVSPMIYVLSSPFYGLDYIYAESYINLPNIQWKKYSNNLQYISPEYYYLSSFSHFTYEETGKQFLIADLQGKLNIFSDPSIQSLGNYNQNLNNDTTNLNHAGIANFIQAHEKCSFICQKLQLENTAAITQFDETKWEFNETQELSIICETCDEYQQIKLIDYVNNGHKKCQQCKELEQVIHEVQCRCCYENFKTPMNQQLRIGTLVGKCEGCKVNCRQPNLICCYCKIHCKLKVSSENIDGKQIYLCKEGKQYLSSLKCKVCNSLYSFDKFLTETYYEQGIYKCQKCN